MTLFMVAVAFSVGFAWGFKSPKRYCHQGTEEANAFGNRLANGVINGAVLAAVAAILALIVFGSGFDPV